jgi:hypothetical protein
MVYKEHMSLLRLTCYLDSSLVHLNSTLKQIKAGNNQLLSVFIDFFSQHDFLRKSTGGPKIEGPGKPHSTLHTSLISKIGSLLSSYPQDVYTKYPVYNVYDSDLFYRSYPKQLSKRSPCIMTRITQTNTPHT